MCDKSYSISRHFADKMNGLRESGRPYREFSDYKDMQDYLDEITGQEIVIESSIRSWDRHRI